MRTTVTLEPDTERLIRQVMEQRGVSFKKALNDLLRAGATPAARATSFRTPTFRMGQPTVNLDRALQLAGELEDEEILRKMRTGQ